MSKEHLDEGLKSNAQLFKALGDETSLRMVGLQIGGELCVCDIMEVLILPQSTASSIPKELWVDYWKAKRQMDVLSTS